MTIIQKTSPNYTQGRQGKSIKKLVIHWIGMGTPESTISWFAGTNSQVSAHYLVADDKVYQFVKDEDTAWHAGNWEVNLESIGIEHYGTPDHPISDATYKSSAELIRTLCQKWDIPIEREFIFKHSEIKSTQCPGTLDIDKLIRLAKEGVVDEHLSEIEKLEKELDDMRSSRDKWKSDYKNLEIKYTSEVNNLINERDALQTTNSTLSERILTLNNEKNSLLDDRSVLQRDIENCLSSQQEKDVKIAELQQKVEKLENKLKKKIMGYTKLELLKALFGR